MRAAEDAFYGAAPRGRAKARRGVAFGSFWGRLVDSAAGQQQTSFLVRGGRLGAREMPQMPRLSGFRVAHAA